MSHGETSSYYVTLLSKASVWGKGIYVYQKLRSYVQVFNTVMYSEFLITRMSVGFNLWCFFLTNARQMSSNFVQAAVLVQSLYRFLRKEFVCSQSILARKVQQFHYCWACYTYLDLDPLLWLNCYLYTKDDTIKISFGFVKLTFAHLLVLLGWLFPTTTCSLLRLPGPHITQNSKKKKKRKKRRIRW